MWREFRPVDLVAITFFGYTSVLALVLPVAHHITIRTLAVNLLVAAFLLSRLWFTRRWHYVVHNFLMLALMLTGYKEMGWFALPHHSTDLEQSWVLWDRWLDTAHFRALVESLGPAIPIILEIAYTLVYATGVISLTSLRIRRGPQNPSVLILFAPRNLRRLRAIPVLPLRTPAHRLPQ